MNNNFNYYKYICLTLLCLFLLACMYYGIPALLDQIAQWRNGGMPVEVAKCSMFASEHLLEVD